MISSEVPTGSLVDVDVIDSKDSVTDGSGGSQSSGSDNNSPPHSNCDLSNSNEYPHIKVSSTEQYKATEIKIFSFARPHMRAFHLSWFSYLISMVCWYCLVPIISEIRSDLKLSRQDIWNANIASIPLASILRIVMGPICDKYGPRIPMSIILCVTAIPVACSGLIIQSGIGLIIVRMLSATGGATFVMTQVRF